MKICIISGSHRQQSNSNKIALYVENRLRILFPESKTDIIKISEEKMPMWDEGMYQADSGIQKIWQPISQRLQAATAFVVIAPEWGGMVPPALKNLLLCSSGAELGHKPALIVAVSGGQGGAYPISELRSSGYKNNQLCFIPEHIIVRHAEQVLNTPDLPQSDFDQHIRERFDYALKLLGLYEKGLTLVRQAEVIDTKKYPYGM